MVLVKDDEIPVLKMHPLIARLDAAGVLVLSKEVLE